MAVRLGRREPCGGRVRLLGAHRLRVRRGRPRAPRPPDRGRPVAPRRAGDARGAGARRPGVRRRRLRSAAPRRACTSAVARSWRLPTRARLFATSRSPPEAGTASGGSPGRPRRGLRSTRPSSVRRAPIRSRRTSSQRSSSSGSWPMPVPQPRRWQRPSAVTRATSRQRLPTRSATARWRRPFFAKGQGPASRVRAGRSAFSPSATQRTTPLPASRMHVAPLPPSPDPGGGGSSMTRLIGDVAAGAQNVAGHIEETGGEVTFQGAAGLKTFGRAGLMALSAFLPRAWERDAASAAGSAWDAGSARRRHRRRRPARWASSGCGPRASRCSAPCSTPGQASSPRSVRRAATIASSRRCRRSATG